jgi:hypothetical protein
MRPSAWSFEGEKMRSFLFALVGAVFLTGCPPKKEPDIAKAADYPCRGTAKAVFETCGCSPVDSSLITLTDALDIDKNIKSSIQGCANGDLSIKAKDAAVAKAAFEACVSKDITIPDDVRAMLSEQVDKATSESLSKSVQLDGWMACYGKVTGVSPAPAQ